MLNSSSRVNNIVYFLAFLPFVNFGFNVFNSDTQPLYLIGILIFILRDIKNLKFTRNEFKLLIFSLCATVILLFTGEDTGKNISLLAIFIALFFFQRYTYNLNLLRVVLFIYSMFFVLWVASPEIAYNVQINLVRDINGIVSSTRGFAVLSTEPGLYAAVAVLLLELFFLKLKTKPKIIDYILISIILLSIILTFSGTSIIFLFLFVLLRLKNKLAILISLFLFLTIPDFLINIFPESRLSYFLKFLSVDNFKLVFTDSSLMYRISSFMVSLEFFINNFFGGLNGENVALKLQDIYLKKYYNPFIYMDKDLRMVSSLGYVIAYAGIFSILFIYNVIKYNFSLKGVAYFIICASFSFSLIFPLTLILLVESSKK